MFYYRKKKYSNPLLSGDDKVIREVYNTAFPLVMKSLKGLGASEDDVKDLIQEGMIIMLHKSEEEIKENFIGYLSLVCRNKWVSELRKKRECTALVENDSHIIKMSRIDYELTREEEEIKLKYDKLLSAYSKLSPKCQKLLEHRFKFRELPLEEEAEKLKMDYHAFRTAKYRANNNLKKKFKNLFGL